MNRVMVVAVHPDDETLGCGGTIFRHKEAGDEVHWLIATRIKEEHGFDKASENNKASEIDKVAAMYDFKSVIKLDLPPLRIDTIPMVSLVEKIAALFNKVKPSIIYIPFRGDVHSDHRVMFDALYSCVKTFRYPFVNAIRMMETISETDSAPLFPDTVFAPNLFVDITRHFDKKLEAMKIYKAELGLHPFPRSLENIKSYAIVRGAMAGCVYAEAFTILRDIWR